MESGGVPDLLAEGSEAMRGDDTLSAPLTLASEYAGRDSSPVRPAAVSSPRSMTPIGPMCLPFPGRPRPTHLLLGRAMELAGTADTVGKAGGD